MTSTFVIVKTKSNRKYIKSNGKDFKCKYNILALENGKLFPDKGHPTKKELARHMNEHREHREWRRCTECSYAHFRQDRVSTHMKVRHGIVPATAKRNPVVPKLEVIPSCSSSSDPIVLLDTPVKTRSGT